MDAQQLFSRTFMTATLRFGMIKSFRQVAKLGLPYAANHLHQEYSDLMEEIFNGTTYDRFFLDKPGALEGMKDPGTALQKLIIGQLSQFEATIDSASLVFAHSILDACALDYCRVAASVSPDSWERYVAGKKISLSDVKGRNHAYVFKAEVAAYVEGLERQSLMTKIDRLFEVCKPPKGFDPIRNFRFDRKRVEALDELRHEVVHGAGTIKPLPMGDADLRFLEQTAAYFPPMIHEQFGMQIDPIEALKAISPDGETQ